MRRIAVVGTELAPLRESSGALERVVLAWADGLERANGLERQPDRYEVVRLDATSVCGPPIDELVQSRPDLVVLNNRPLWAEALADLPVLGDLRVLHVLHNYPDAWGEHSDDHARVRRVLQGGEVSAVSAALARHVEAAYQLTRAVREVRVEVAVGYFGESWRGEGGPVVFPNRLLEKKGVRLFLEMAAKLTAGGRRCVMSRHLSPWVEPTAEQRLLLTAIEDCGSVDLIEPPPTRSAMAAWYASAGVVVCPSIHPEGLGLVALEAQAVGAPLVTSGLGGLAEATFPPNEIVAGSGVTRWCSAIERAARRRPTSLPTEMTREAYGEEAAARSFAGAVDSALRRARPTSRP